MYLVAYQIYEAAASPRVGDQTGEQEILKVMLDASPRVGDQAGIIRGVAADNLASPRVGDQTHQDVGS